MKKIIKNIAVCSMTSIMIVSSILPVYASSKTEVIYSKRNSDGSVNKNIVSEHITGTSEDKSILENILNVNNNDIYTKKGDILKWTSDDVYYQGTTKKELPISMKVKYYLNGEERNLKDILGKSGNIKIVIKYINNLKNVVDINNKTEILYTPFVISTGLILDNSKNTNIKANNGIVTTNGTNSILVGINAPGLYESLNIDKLKGIDTFTVEYKTTEFSLPTIYSVGTPKLLDSSDLDIFDKADDLYKKVDKLDKATKQIEDGSKSLDNGIASLEQGMKELNEGLKQEDAGIKQAYDKLDTLISSLESSLESAVENGNTLDEKTLDSIAKSASEKAVESIMTDEYTNSIKQAAKKEVDSKFTDSYKDAIGKKAYQDAVESMKEQGITDEQTLDLIGKTAYQTAISTAYQTALQTAQDTATNTAKDAAGKVSYNTAYSIASKVADQVAAEAKKTTKEKITTIDGYLNQLKEGLNTLHDGTSKLSSGSDKLTYGSQKLKEGSNTLYSGIKEYNDNGIAPIVNYVNNEIKPNQAKVEKLLKLSNSYKTFDSLKDGIDGSTKIVMMIDGQEKENKTTVKVEKASEKETFWDRVRKFLNNLF